MWTPERLKNIRENLGIELSHLGYSYGVPLPERYAAALVGHSEEDWISWENKTLAPGTSTYIQISPNVSLDPLLLALEKPASHTLFHCGKVVDIVSNE